MLIASPDGSGRQAASMTGECEFTWYPRQVFQVPAGMQVGSISTGTAVENG
jgi:hypothetical protein